jgi:hypothetical protein
MIVHKFTYELKLKVTSFLQAKRATLSADAKFDAKDLAPSPTHVTE